MMPEDVSMCLSILVIVVVFVVLRVITEQIIDNSYRGGRNDDE